MGDDNLRRLTATVAGAEQTAGERPAWSDQFAMAQGGAGLDRLARETQGLLDLLSRTRPAGPYGGASPQDLAGRIAGSLKTDVACSPEVLHERLSEVIANSIDIAHPHAAAHLHCPTLTTAVAVELLVAALNPSLDSFDQAPMATMVELNLVEHLCDKVGYPSSASGTFTPGATQSNFFALLLARERFYQRQWGRSAWEEGLGDEVRRLRIVCSEASHFSVEKSAAQLGMGCRSVVRVPCDADFKMSPAALRETLARLAHDGALPMAIVATAGTTDAGAIDPLEEIASIAREAGIWLHVDAAYGGSLLFSNRHVSRLQGIEASDSVCLDFHKLLWQPIGCGALLVRDDASFERIRMHADYLNPESHESQGVPDLVTRSLLTTRRFDALKLWVTLQSVGSRQLGEWIDLTLERADAAARYIASHPRLELMAKPQLGCVLFRYSPANSDESRMSATLDAINARVRQDLFTSGEAVIGETRVRGQVGLKFTCLNPLATNEDYRKLIDRIVDRAGILVSQSDTNADRLLEASPRS